MDTRYQSWPAGSTSPRPIPSASPRLAPLNPAVYSEWQKLCGNVNVQQNRLSRFGFTPRNLSRPHTPPSLSPSPAPSQGSHHTDYFCDDDIEIEEIADEGGDSGVEMIIGEYEEGPENYGEPPIYDSEAEEIAESHRDILYGLEKLSATRASPPISRAMVQQRFKLGAQPRKAKRSYAESVGTTDSDYDSGVDSQSSERRIRRVVSWGGGSVEAVSVGNSYANSPASDYEVDMEL